MEAKPTSGEDWTEESRVRQGLLIGGPYKEVRRGMGIPQIGGEKTDIKRAVKIYESAKQNGR